MTKAKARSMIVDDSLKAIPSVKNHKDLRGGLVGVLMALVNKEITAEESRAITNAAKRQMTRINKGVLKEIDQ